MADDKSLEDKIREWLETQGYPLEMQVAQLMRVANFRIRQSHHYTDPESGKSRELDLVADGGIPARQIYVVFYVECKKTSRPWLLFTAEDTLKGFNPFFAFGVLTENARDMLMLELDERKSNVETLPWFVKEGRVAYGVTEAFTSGKDQPFDAWISALKAALVARDEAAAADKKNLVFAFPVVVTNSNLFECYLNSSGELEVNEITDAFLFSSIDVGGNRGTCIRVVTNSGLERFRDDARALSEGLSGIAQEMFKL